MSLDNNTLAAALFVASSVVLLLFKANAPKPKPASKISKRATFGAGCYWGTERYFKRDFGKKVFPGVGRIVQGKVGFMGPRGAKANPTYKEVCAGGTQQVEVYDLDFEGDEQTYEALVRHFFMFHDPTTLHQQEGDVGFQYSSVIYVHDEQQREIATRVKKEVQELVRRAKIVSYKNAEVVTDIAPATEFFPAHEEHQEYLDKNPSGYCTHRYRFLQWPKL